MSADLLNRIDQYLNDLHETQAQFRELLGVKRAAMIAARPAEILQAAQTEALLAQRLRQALNRRREILDEAARDNLPAGSLSELAAVIAGGPHAALADRLDRARRATEELRREGWNHWIISHRTCQQYTDLLNLIAHCGEKPPTYSRDAHDKSIGGVILDATV